MFDELKEVKYFKEITDFDSLQKSEVYLESKRAYTMERFVNILNSLLFSQCKLRLRFDRVIYRTSKILKFSK